MKVVVDGQPLSQGWGETVDEMVSPQDVRALEIYPDHGIGAPVEDRGPDAYCHVVVIWTKQG